MRSEKVIMLFLMLPCLRNVYRDPAGGIQIKLCPAVVSRNLRGALIGGNRKPDLKARGNLLRPRHRNKNRVKIGAVAMLRIAGPERVAVSPAGAGLVID